MSIPFQFNPAQFVRQGGDADLNNVICNDLSVNGTLFYNDAIVAKNKTINGTLTVQGDASFNSVVYAKQMGVNVVNDEAYASGNNMLKVAGHMNIDNFNANAGSGTNSALLVVGNNSNNQFVKFKTQKTGTGIGATSIDFKNVNADATGVDYLSFKNDGSQIAYLYKDGRFRASQLDLQVDSNTGTYINLRDNVGDLPANDIMTFKSGIDGSEFPSAHFIDISAVGDYSAGETEIFLSTDKNKASYIDVSFVGIGTKTPEAPLHLNKSSGTQMIVQSTDTNETNIKFIETGTPTKFALLGCGGAGALNLQYKNTADTTNNKSLFINDAGFRIDSDQGTLYRFGKCFQCYAFNGDQSFSSSSYAIYSPATRTIFKLAGEKLAVHFASFASCEGSSTDQFRMRVRLTPITPSASSVQSGEYKILWDGGSGEGRGQTSFNSFQYSDTNSDVEDATEVKIEFRYKRQSGDDTLQIKDGMLYVSTFN